MSLTRYGPKSSLSPTVGDPCPLCGNALAAGDYTALVRRERGGRYANNAVEVHWLCATKKWPKVTTDG